jgi:hypothetical protein
MEKILITTPQSVLLSRDVGRMLSKGLEVT